MDAAGYSWSPGVGSRFNFPAPFPIWCSAILSAALSLSAIILIERRIAGGLTVPLSTLLLIAVALAAAAATCTVHLLSAEKNELPVARAWAVAERRSTILALPIVAIAISLPGSPTFGLFGLWLTVALAELGLWQLQKHRPRTIITDLSIGRRAAIPPPPAVTLPSAIDDEVLLCDRIEAPTATQKLVYHRADDGSLRVEGWLQAPFIADQRTSIVHVAFCPAFDGAPNVEAELVDGPPGELRPTLVLPWGVRWEVKLAAPAATPTAARFEFIANEARS